MSMLFSSYRDNEDDNYSGMMARRMRNSLSEDGGPVHQQHAPSNRRPRVVARRRRRTEDE